MYVAFINLEKVYGEVCVLELWRVLNKYGVKEY